MAASAGWLFWNFMVHPLLSKRGPTSPLRWLLTAARIVFQEEGKSTPPSKVLREVARA
jgi:hypothetical protein